VKGGLREEGTGLRVWKGGIRERRLIGKEEIKDKSNREEEGGGSGGEKNGRGGEKMDEGVGGRGKGREERGERSGGGRVGSKGWEVRGGGRVREGGKAEGKVGEEGLREEGFV